MTYFPRIWVDAVPVGLSGLFSCANATAETTAGNDSAMIVRVMQHPF